MVVFADASTPFPKFIVQVYLPESDSCRKCRLYDEVYSTKNFIPDSVAAASVLLITVPSGPFNVVLTDNGTCVIE